MDKQTWKVSDIAGSDVFDEEGQLLGKLVDVLPTGGNDVWVIAADSVHPHEFLVPALATVIRNVDTLNKRITIAVPPGLKEIYEER